MCRNTGSGEPCEVVVPGVGTVLGSVASATLEDLDRAVEAAAAAQMSWAAVPYTERAAVMLKASQLLAENPARL